MQRVAPMALATLATAEQTQKNPMSTVISLIDELTAKVIKDGADEQKAYHEYFEWCDDTSKNTGFAIETATKEKNKLDANIEELSSEIQVAASKIDDLASAIASSEKELKDATIVRDKEVSDFEASEKELVDALSALRRAIGILEKEMAKNPASFAQIDTSSITNTLQALSVVLDAAALPTGDRSTLMALAQTQASEEDEAPGAPAAATYKTHSTGVLDVLEDLQEKAQAQLSDLRKAEMKTRQNYDMLKNSLEAQTAADEKEKGEQTDRRTAANEGKATAEGDLDVTTKELAASEKQLATARSSCIQVAADHEATVAARKEELAVIAKAKQILVDTSVGAVEKTYSFLQTVADEPSFAGSRVASAVKALARKEHSSALAQLASRISATAKYGASNGDDVFGKIKGLIRDMIQKLENEAQAEAEEKAFCDEQIAKTEFKKGELEDDIAKQTARIDKAAARATQLKGEIKELQAELRALAKEQAEMDRIRADTHAAYSEAKDDLELGLSGLRKALNLLRDYYQNGDALLQQPAVPEKFEKASGAGGGIIDILEVCESDFATNLAKEEQEESDAQAEYEKVSQANAVTKTEKDSDVKYKSSEAKSQDETVVEYSADRKSSSAELDAVLEYYAKIKDRCIAVPETYEERKRRREAEIEGLKTALAILKDETALFQRKHRSSFRGALEA